MVKHLTHYKDNVTGRYVTKAKWRKAKARGSVRYKRTYERYVKGVRGPEAELKAAQDKQRLQEIEEILGEDFTSLAEAEAALAEETEALESIERVKYLPKDRYDRKYLDIEVTSYRGKITAIRVGRRTYRQRASIILLTPLIEEAREAGTRVSSRVGKRKARRK